MGFIHHAASRRRPWLLYYASHHVHSPQFAGPVCTNSTPRGRFGDSLAELDSAVEELLLAAYGVPEAGLPVNSLFFFTSDNGPSLRNEVRGGNAGLLKCGKG